MHRSFLLVILKNLSWFIVNLICYITVFVFQLLIDVLLPRWMSLFPRHNIHVVNGDTFARNLVPELTQLESFLRLPRYFTQSHFYLNTTKGFYCYYNNQTQEQCLKKDKGMRHPEISPGLHRQLALFLEPHNNKFYKLVGQDFGWNS